MPTATKSISSSINLSSFTVATFITTAQTAFKNSVALTAGKTAADVSITSITAAAASKRHLLTGGVTVAFTIAAASDADAAGVTAALNAPTAMQTLAQYMTSAGVAVNAADIAIAQAPVTATSPSASSPAAARCGGVAMLAAAALAVLVTL